MICLSTYGEHVHAALYSGRFAVRGRENLIAKQHREELQKYMAGIVQQKGCKLLAIYYMPDHCHILIGLKPDIALSDLIRDVKANSTKFIKEKSWTKGSFQWQEGFGAFSYAQSQLAEVRRYIQNQEEHHRQRSFQEEYLAFLQKYEVDYDERYLFK